MPVRFRTQDTRASWARKLNELTALIPSITMTLRFEATPDTMLQWERVLDALRVTVIEAGYPLDDTGPFRIADTRQMWARKLNLLAVAIEAGPADPEPEPEPDPEG